MFISDFVRYQSMHHNYSGSKSAMSNGNYVFATIVANKLGHLPHFCDVAKEHLYYLICPSFLTKFTS